MACWHLSFARRNLERSTTTLHWWIQRPTLPSTVTSGNSTLLGGEIGPREFSGIQGQLGLWLDPDHVNAMEITGQWLGKASRQYPFSSNAAGSPALSIPLLMPTAAGIVAVATPGKISGSVNVNNVMNFYGAEMNFTQNVVRVSGWTFDYFGGGRYLYMNDNLSFNQTRTALSAGA